MSTPEELQSEISARRPIIERILSEVRKAVPGEVVGIELEHEHGAWVYEIKVIQAGGMRAEVLVDARSGRIVSVKGK